MFYLDIILQPVSINTTLNSTVIFTCEATAVELTFRVNNKPANDADVTSKGFTVTTSGTGILRGELQAIAYDFNNNTNIRCRASTDSPPAILLSNTAVLMIQGLCALVHTIVLFWYTVTKTKCILLLFDILYYNQKYKNNYHNKLLYIQYTKLQILQIAKFAFQEIKIYCWILLLYTA